MVVVLIAHQESTAKVVAVLLIGGCSSRGKETRNA